MARRKNITFTRRRDLKTRGHDHAANAKGPRNKFKTPVGINSPRWKDAKWSGRPFVYKIGAIRSKGG